MEPKSWNEERLAQYLLGELPEEEMLDLEENYFLDDALFDELRAAELELIDRYLEGNLSSSEQDRFENFFLSTPVRQEKLRFARALKKYTPGQATGRRRHIFGNSLGAFSHIHKFVTSPVGIAASIILILCVGLGIWRVLFYQSPQSRVIAALSNAYREQRYVEPRISGIDYAPLSQVRGGDQSAVDIKERSRAELIALDEISENPTAESHHSLGQVYLAEQKFDEAIAEFKKALELDRGNARTHSDLGAALFEQARSDEDSQNRATALAESLSYMNKALEIDGTRLEALFNRALWHEYMALPRQAENDWRKYLELDPSSQWAVEARKHLESLEEKISPRTSAHLYEEFYRAYMARDDEAAWKVLRQSRARTGNIINETLIDEYLGLSLEGKADDASGRLQMLSYAGKLEYEIVGDRFTKDLARFYATTDDKQQKSLFQARHMMKSAYESYGRTEYEEAIKLYLGAKDLLQQAEDTCGAAVAECWIGNCYLRIPDVKHSLSIFERISPTFAEHQYKWLLAQALNAISDANSSQREFSKTLEIAERSMNVSEGIQDPRGVIRNLQLYVAIHQQYGDYAKSLNFARRAFDLAKSFSPEPYEIWPFYHQVAFEFYSLGFPSVAIEFQEEALRLAIESKAPLLKSRSYARLALIWQALRNFNEAIRCAELALAEAENVAGEKSKNNLIANSILNLAHLYKEAGDFERAVGCYDRAIQIHERLGLHIYVFEAHRGKLLSLIGQKDDSAIGEEVITAVSLLEQDRWKIMEESSRNKYFDLAQDIYDIAIDYAYSHSQGASKAFTYSEASHGRSLLDMLSTDAQLTKSNGELDLKHRTVMQPLALSEIQQRLPEHSQILQYSLLNDKIITWVISKNDIRVTQQQVRLDKLNEKIRDFVNAITQAPESKKEQIVTEAKSLYDLLIKPVEAILDRSHQLYIVPDKILNSFPFGALISPASSKYFAEEYLFEFSPSSSFVIKCSEAALKKEKVQNENLLCVGDPSFDRSQFKGLPRLTSASEEAVQVASLYDSRPPLTGGSATENRVRAEMPGADVMHFAGHYVVDKRSPMLSKLLLAAGPAGAGNDEASDGFLQASEIYSMKLPRTRLVVLSACETGIEQYYRGEGAISLVRAFIKAGVPIVVASLWLVESDPTEKLMISFHKYRKQQGLSTVEALRSAQRDMISSPDPVDRQPRCWASFVLIGGYAKF